MKKSHQKFSYDSSGKFLFMRHGETRFNQDPDPYRQVYPGYTDCDLSENGIKQAKMCQEQINKLSIKEVYVSPFYRALQTASICLENHPNIHNISVIVQPLLAEIEGCTHDFLYDINKNKNNFSNKSKVKFDWSEFDKYVQNIKYDDNFFYFNEFNMIENKIKNEFYSRLKKYYTGGNMSFFEKELEKLSIYRIKTGIRFESLKHEYERFVNFYKYLYEKYKDNLDDKNNKILCISHSSFIKIGTSLIPYESDKITKSNTFFHILDNCQIVSINLDLV